METEFICPECGEDLDAIIAEQLIDVKDEILLQLKSPDITPAEKEVIIKVWNKCVYALVGPVWRCKIHGIE